MGRIVENFVTVFRFLSLIFHLDVREIIQRTCARFDNLLLYYQQEKEECRAARIVSRASFPGGMAGIRPRSAPEPRTRRPKNEKVFDEDMRACQHAERNLCHRVKI